MELDIFLKIILAALLGGIIGLERELSHKEAGLRTNILIAMGSALITILSFKFAEVGKGGDPGRLAAQIVTGIGFLGAGAIIQARLAVHGLTTAATIWTVSAIGMTVGYGLYTLGLFMTLLVVVVLTAFKYFALALERQRKTYTYLVSTEDRAAILFEIRSILTELNVKSLSSRLSKNRDGYEFEITFSTSENKNQEFVGKVMPLQGVREIVSESFL